MGAATAQVVAFGVGVTISPLAIIAVTLLLGGAHGRLTAGVFVAAWALGLIVLGTLVLLIADGANAAQSGTPATWVGVLKLVLAALLLWVAGRQWRGRPGSEAQAELPGWMESVESFTPAKAATSALLFATVKPKNLLLTIGAATAIAETGATSAQQAAALLVFVVIGTLGPALPLVVYLLARDRASAVLTEMRDWMVRENTTVIVVLCVVIAAKLVGDGLATLTG